MKHLTEWVRARRPRPGRRRRPVGVRPGLEGLEVRALLNGSGFGVSGFLEEALAAAGKGALGESAYKNPPSPIGTTATSFAANVNTDVEGQIHNETAIAINPRDPLNMVAGANDYQLRPNPGGQVYETIYTRAHVTFDGGHTWSEYPIVTNNYLGTGDPTVAFDADGTAYLGMLGVGGGLNNPGVSADILVAHSADGGKTWSTPARVASGTGNAVSHGIFNDKDGLAAWGHGNAIATWTVFVQGQHGAVLSNPIYASVTHDGGKTWTPGVPISGPYTNDQGSEPVVTADGRIFVAFEGPHNDAIPSSGDATRGAYYVVQVDPATGRPLADPVPVAEVYDGAGDYPYNVDGSPTYQDSEFRSWAVGNLAADPTDPGHLAVIWSDMRNTPGVGAVDPDPYAAKTNSDIVVSQSFDGGRTWSAPAALALPNDQFQPWGAYTPDGRLQVGFFDRSYDPANHRYGYTLASETAPGSLDFALQQVTTALSDPTRDDRWFSRTTVNDAFPHPTRFLGDYSGIAASPTGQVAALWTDMREPATFQGQTGWGEDAYFALVDPTVAPVVPASAVGAAVPTGLIVPLVPDGSPGARKKDRPSS